MQGFLLYMIIGAVIIVYRMHFESVPETESWYKSRQIFLDRYSSWSVLIQVPVFLILALLGLPIMMTDYTLFFISRLSKARYNTKEVKKDVSIYVYYGLMHGEAVSYSSYNRFNEEEAKQIEEAFKKAEQKIIKHGFVPFTVGNFVEAHQGEVPLPRLQIKGRKSND